MLRTSVVSALFLLSLTLKLSCQQVQQSESSAVRVKARVVEQKYCRGDADVFSIWLRVELEIDNSSNKPAYLLWPMVPWVGMVASSIADAEVGRFLYEQTASHYPQSRTHLERLKLEPGKVLKRSEYYLIARHSPAFSLPRSVAAGSYGLVLVLRPEEEPPPELRGSEIVQTITTKPFLVRVPSHPKLAVCGVEGKAS